jgi:hypothetical protein
MRNVVLEKEVKLKQQARDITKTILDFGVTDSQKYDIMYFLASSLENHQELQEVTSFLKKYKKTINNESEDTKIENKPKLIT